MYSYWDISFDKIAFLFVKLLGFNYVGVFLRDALIISLSLGASRTFAYRLNTQLNIEHTVRLGDGDLCTMEGMMQKYYKHAILPEKGKAEPRINLTWRWIVA